MIEVVKACDYYGPHAKGWVVRDGERGHRRRTKREAEDLKLSLEAEEKARKMEEGAALYRHRLKMLGSKLMAKYPQFHWEHPEGTGLWLVSDESEREAIREMDCGQQCWRLVLGEPDLISMLYECEEWAGFTLD